MLRNLDGLDEDLGVLCETVRTLIRHAEYWECEEIISEAMGRHPHAPEPHNLYGIILEKEGLHPEAMKHFRAAWALDPTYVPARYNLDKFGTFDNDGTFAIDVSDCRPDRKGF